MFDDSDVDATIVIVYYVVTMLANDVYVVVCIYVAVYVTRVVSVFFSLRCCCCFRCWLLYAICRVTLDTYIGCLASTVCCIAYVYVRYVDVGDVVVVVCCVYTFANVHCWRVYAVVYVGCVATVRVVVIIVYNECCVFVCYIAAVDMRDRWFVVGVVFAIRCVGYLCCCSFILVFIMLLIVWFIVLLLFVL